MTVEELALMGIEPVQILYVYSWGFGAILWGWLMGYGVALAVAVIKRI